MSTDQYIKIWQVIFTEHRLSRSVNYTFHLSVYLAYALIKAGCDRLAGCLTVGGQSCQYYNNVVQSQDWICLYKVVNIVVRYSVNYSECYKILDNLESPSSSELLASGTN